MMPNEEWGLVGKAAISALRPRGLTSYSVSKGAVIALTKAIAVDHGAGPVYTPMVYARGMTEQARDTRRQASVLKREGTGLGRRRRRALSIVRPSPLHHRPGPGR
jgi:NAD(P)-dependent dehydrogenase (short-subunit alcohol dehydrogenase family)